MMKPISQPTDDLIRQSLEQALAEDIGSGDITAQLIPASEEVTAQLKVRENAILCGVRWFNAAFQQVDPDIQIQWHYHDGNQVTADSVLCKLQGSARGIMTAERTAINFLQSLSGTATVTNEYVTALKGTSCQLLDTRKTIPGLRQAQKYAVTCGGGQNHRIGLYDAYLIKENHIKACGSITAAIEEAKRRQAKAKVEIEVESLTELEEAIQAGADIVMLDNFTKTQLKDAVDLNQSRVKLEVSGNVTLDSIQSVAQTGIDFISVGALTKHLRAIDFSLRVN